MNVYAIGASRNIGYYSAVRLLSASNPFLRRTMADYRAIEKGATVTFLLRSLNVFETDELIQGYVKSGHVRLVQGDALKAEDVAKGWEAAQEGPQSHVDLVLFTLGM